MATCYRHPNRETGVSCSNCGNPICPDCMTATPVGMRCPDCAKQRTPTRTLQSLAIDPIATYVLMAINVLVFFGIRSSAGADNDLTLFASGRFEFGGELHGVAEGEYWRLITSGFAHTEFWHIGFNMLALYWLGRMIEPALGHARFVAIYLTSLLTGSLAVLIMQPNVETLGASGAVYGLLGAAVVMARNREIDLMQSGLIPIIALNFVITIVFGFSLAGHVGGLIGGLVVTFVVEELAKRRRNSTVPAVAFCALVSVAAIAGSIYVASN
jgi:membrane associated rhomboid family serine protease